MNGSEFSDMKGYTKIHSPKFSLEMEDLKNVKFAVGTFFTISFKTNWYQIHIYNSYIKTANS